MHGGEDLTVAAHLLVLARGDVPSEIQELAAEKSDAVAAVFQQGLNVFGEFHVPFQGDLHAVQGCRGEIAQIEERLDLLLMGALALTEFVKSRG